jgi:hypothetical protein
MSRTIHGFRNFEEASQHEIDVAALRSPQDRILLLHRLIAAWMKFPRIIKPTDEGPILKRIKNAS